MWENSYLENQLITGHLVDFTYHQQLFFYFYIKCMVLNHKASINVFSSKINKVHYVKKIKTFFLIFIKVRFTIDFKNCHSLVFGEIWLRETKFNYKYQN